MLDKKDNNKIALNNNLTIFKDKDFEYIYKKTEQLSTAVYMVTNFFDKEEPLKWNLREGSVCLLNSVMSLSNATLQNRDEISREISKELYKVISLFNIAFRSGFISSMNYEIINYELNHLGQTLSEKDTNQLSANQKLFEDDFFKVEYSKGQEKQHTPVKDTKGHESKKTTNSNTKSIESSTSFNRTESKNDREQKIMSIVKEKGNISVKDISDRIKDFSEKTLQRELLKMVAKGVLNKEGERRWSRYSLK